MRPSDPIELAVFSNLISAVTEEGCGTIARTAFTTFVKETNDFAFALAALDGTFFAYPRKSGVTTFIGLPLAEVIQSVTDWVPGDILFTNDPYSTGGLVTHAPDINLIAPIYFEDEIVAFCWAFMHSSDMGGRVPGSIAPSSDEIYQEGIRIPPIKLYRGGELNEDLLKILKTNVRIPHQVWGDTKALISAFHVATARVQEIFEKYGLERTKALINEVLAFAEAKARTVIAAIPAGTYRFVDYLEDDIGTNLPVRICLALEVSNAGVHLDFTGTDPQVLAAFNLATSGKTHGWLAIGFIHYLLTEDPQIPVNGGLLRTIRVTAPPGTLVHALPPAALGARISSGVRILEITLGALAQAVPDRVPAAGSGQGMLPVISMPALATGNRKVNVLQPLTGGSGGRPSADGYDGTDYSFGFLKNTPIEIIESEMDVRVQWYGYVPDSGGPGRYRGGLGVQLAFEALVPDTVLAVRGMERTRFAPWGVHGGKCGALTQPAIINRGKNNMRTLPKLDILKLDAGDVLELASSGGGGYGDPLDRKLHQIEEDVLFGYVTRPVAEQVYGVVFGSSGAVDQQATEARRRELKSKKRGNGSAFDFGLARREHETIWNEAAYVTLAEILRTCSPHARVYAKRIVMAKANELNIDARPLTVADVRRAWDISKAALGVSPT